MRRCRPFSSPQGTSKHDVDARVRVCLVLFCFVFSVHSAAADTPPRQPWGLSAGLQQGSALASVVSVYRNHHWQRVPKLLLVEVRMEHLPWFAVWNETSGLRGQFGLQKPFLEGDPEQLHGGVTTPWHNTTRLPGERSLRGALFSSNREPGLNLSPASKTSMFKEGGQCQAFTPCNRFRDASRRMSAIASLFDSMKDGRRALGIISRVCLKNRCCGGALPRVSR